MSIVNWVDIAILTIILFLAFDALRQVRFYRQPLRTVVFVLVSIGSFGWIAHNLHGEPVHWWSLSMHSGFAVYAVRMFRRPITRRGVIHVEPDRRRPGRPAQGAGGPVDQASSQRPSGTRP